VRRGKDEINHKNKEAAIIEWFFLRAFYDFRRFRASFLYSFLP